jgi:hypothetical protein
MLPVGTLLLAALLALALTGAFDGSGVIARAVGAPSAGEPTAQTDDSVPAREVTMIGSSPAEAPGETWGIGEVGTVASNAWGIVRYTTESGWSLAPGPLDAGGQPLSGFEPDRSLLTGEMTPGGAGVLLGTVAGHGVVLVRNPGGTFTETAPVRTEGEELGAGEEPLLKSGEKLFSTARAPLVAALEEASGVAGALVVPVSEGANAENQVLHWDGHRWASEPIEVPKASEEKGGFRVLAIAASPHEVWLLAQLSSGSPSVALFRRHLGAGGEPTSWQPVAPAPGQTAGAPLQVKTVGAEVPFTVPGTGEPPTAQAQILTATDEGVWIDGERTDAHVRLTMFFKPAEDGAASGEVLASWCNASASSPSCTHPLPEESLPTGPSRSFAWANSSAATPFGERVITGLGEGVSLRLEDTEFTRVLALGGSEAPEDVGGTLGAAFSNPHEGWLGNSALPVHLTMDPAPNLLTPYPVPFRHALTAIAPQPGAPVGALSSEALAVGDQGEVARYEPGEGWQPESLFGAGGRVETPRLRAVAWPTPSRAYAVGELGQMWLWRDETGLWEPDPATPVNFRGNLLGIAFDPSDPSRGYAVGQQGVLLRYGKTWTQEELPPEVAGASFTSIAFAGSEAIVAYRQIHLETATEGDHYTGGLLVNDGSGWHVDQGAALALGRNVPWAVAGLPDGGAALSATPGGYSEAPLILERESSQAPWLPTPPYPGGEAPGSLALFREGDALRAVGSGGVPSTIQFEDERPPPAGFPPNLIKPYPLATGYVIRQTAVGWSDEEHERNDVRDPLGEYKAYDMVYQPDPTSAILVDSTGTQGWAVGGVVEERGNGRLDTADVDRYPADGVAPPGFATAPVPTQPTEATFALAGGAQCLAPCSARANARLGPDVWLSSALEQARQITGVRAFLYTGARVTSGEGHGLFAVPYAREFARYAALLSSSLPAFPVSSPSDRGPGSECAFKEAFAGFPGPFGDGAPAAGLEPAGSGAGPSEPCAGYYALESTGPAGAVRVIVLDDATDVGEAQRQWLAVELGDAKAHRGAGGSPEPEPAIVLGSADLNAQIAAGDPAAQAVAETLIGGGASAYFYDAPEQNLEQLLRGSSIPTFGSGTLGYVAAVHAEEQDFLGQMGFLLAEVNAAPSARKPNNVAPVKARLIPNIGELALEAKGGVLLRRSHAALFDALARRPLAGGKSQRGINSNEAAQYIPIPANCIGGECASRIPVEYEFSSSNPDIGEFVEPNLASPEPQTTVLLGPGEKPVPDSKSGLFCAYNAGTTVVTISAGGLSSSLAVTVQAGSVRRPCGTQPLKGVASQQQVVPAPVPPPAPAPTPAPASAPPPVPLPPPPPPMAPPAPVHQVLPKPPPPPFVPLVAVSAPVFAFVPPPVPTPARPTPPTGTSAVTSPVEVAEREEEREEAPESVSNEALAYSAPEHEPSPAYALGVVILAAFAGAGVRRRPRRGRRELRVAPATLSTMRAQRRASVDRRRP